MTTISANAAFSFGLGASQASAEARFVLAAGVLRSTANPLGASARAFAMLPTLWALTAFPTAAAKPEPQFTATTGADGRASIDLGDGYALELNETNSEITILNAKTTETTRIWGDPHVDVDGKHAFDFMGTTTFELDNGTKITIDTEPWSGNPDAYVASGVTITKGDQAVVVEGISQNRLGDLSISLNQKGRAIDAATRDGYVLHENATGSGWISSISGQMATQTDLNATLAGGAYGPGSTLPSVDELSDAISGFLFGATVFAAVELDSTVSPAARPAALSAALTAH